MLCDQMGYIFDNKQPMKTQTLQIMGNDKLCADKSFCTAECEARDWVLQVINLMLDKEWGENIEALASQPIDCHLDWEECRIEVERIIT